MAHSVETKDKCHAMYVAGNTIDQIADDTGVSARTLYMWFKNNRQSSVIEHNEEAKTIIRDRLSKAVDKYDVFEILEQLLNEAVAQIDVGKAEGLDAETIAKIAKTAAGIAKDIIKLTGQGASEVSKIEVVKQLTAIEVLAALEEANGDEGTTDKENKDSDRSI